MQFPHDKNGVPIPAFSPEEGVTLSGTYLDSKEFGDTGASAFRLASSVDITIDGKTVTYYAGECIVLRAGVSYTFSAAVDAHKM